MDQDVTVFPFSGSCDQYTRCAAFALLPTSQGVCDPDLTLEDSIQELGSLQGPQSFALPTDLAELREAQKDWAGIVRIVVEQLPGATLLCNGKIRKDHCEPEGSTAMTDTPGEIRLLVKALAEAARRLVNQRGQ